MLNPKEKVNALLDALLNFPAFVDAVMADGWTRGMAERGFELHQNTWRGIDEVMSQIETVNGRDMVEKVCHVWPALPGAGVSPVLFGVLCGVKTQHIKASRRGQHFANYFVSLANDFGVRFSEDLFSSDYERLIVSGSDDTISYFNAKHDHVIGFGHRESVAVVDANFQDFEGLATDIAQWDQQGCFSVRAVFYIGDNSDAFSQKLANALFEREGEASHDSGALTSRIQRRAIAEMTSQIFVDHRGRNENCAWVQSASGPWLGGTPAAGCVSVYDIDSKQPESLISLIGLPSHNRQGVSLFVSFSGLEEELFSSGFTHISPVGQIQSPPLNWLHDGRSNVDMFLK